MKERRFRKEDEGKKIKERRLRKEGWKEGTYHDQLLQPL
jgi:hypothetical protein